MQAKKRVIRKRCETELCTYRRRDGRIRCTVCRLSPKWMDCESFCVSKHGIHTYATTTLPSPRRTSREPSTYRPHTETIPIPESTVLTSENDYCSECGSYRCHHICTVPVIFHRVGHGNDAEQYRTRPITWSKTVKALGPASFALPRRGVFHNYVTTTSSTTKKTQMIDLHL